MDIKLLYKIIQNRGMTVYKSQEKILGTFPIYVGKKASEI
jgi:hypothetical protein